MRIRGSDRVWYPQGGPPVLALSLNPVTPERVSHLNTLLAPMDDEHHLRRRAYTSAEVALIVGVSQSTLGRWRVEHRDELSWRAYGGRIKFLPEDIELLRAFLARGGGRA